MNIESKKLSRKSKTKNLLIVGDVSSTETKIRLHIPSISLPLDIDHTLHNGDVIENRFGLKRTLGWNTVSA